MAVLALRGQDLPSCALLRECHLNWAEETGRGRGSEDVYSALKGWGQTGKQTNERASEGTHGGRGPPSTQHTDDSAPLPAALAAEVQQLRQSRPGLALDVHDLGVWDAFHE